MDHFPESSTTVYKKRKLYSSAEPLLHLPIQAAHSPGAYMWLKGCMTGCSVHAGSVLLVQDWFATGVTFAHYWLSAAGPRLVCYWCNIRPLLAQAVLVQCLDMLTHQCCPIFGVITELVSSPPMFGDNRWMVAHPVPLFICFRRILSYTCCSLAMLPIFETFSVNALWYVIERGPANIYEKGARTFCVKKILFD